jgi:uncharacterized protein YndB with AHSA1/START domain
MTPSATSGSATVRIAAPADTVFAVLTDLELLPTFSPENQRCEFLGETTSIEVGATFRGYNKARDYEWHADCVVTEFEPGRSFGYEVPPGFEHATTWRYVVEPDGEGCKVTESFDAPMLALPDVYPGKIEGRRDNLAKACEITLANLKAAVEGSAVEGSAV